ncbi:MAG: phage major capsid protein [Methylococcales bacterium]
MPLATIYPMATNALTILAGDAEDRSTGSIAGMRGTWLTEPRPGWFKPHGCAQSNYGLRNWRFSADLLSDAPSFEVQLRKIMADSASFSLDESFLVGDGVGKPLGILSSPSAITVTKESGQAADTIVYRNLTRMWARLLPSSTGTAVWLAHPSVVPSLFQMSFEGASSSVPAYMPAGSGVTGPAPQSLFGRPLIFSEKLPQLGDHGDLTLVDLNKYAIGVRQDLGISASTDAAFMSDEITFRLVMRVAGKPLMNNAVKPRSGTDSLSWAVTLEDRT